MEPKLMILTLFCLVWFGRGAPISLTEQCENNARRACLSYTTFNSFNSCWAIQTQNCIKQVFEFTYRSIQGNCEETEETRVVLLCLESVCQYVSYSVPIVEC